MDLKLRNPNAKPAPLAHRFPSLANLPQQQEAAKNTRWFKGNGTDVLSVPGLKKLKGIKIGLQPIPLFEERDYPTDAHGRYESIIEPIVILDHTPDGRPILRRSPLSNHGIWQRGVTIYVEGDWEDKKAKAAKGETSDPDAPPTSEEEDNGDGEGDEDDLGLMGSPGDASEDYDPMGTPGDGPDGADAPPATPAVGQTRKKSGDRKKAQTGPVIV